MKENIVCIQENKMEVEEASRVLGVRHWWSGFFVEEVGASGGLGILWSPRLLKHDPLIKKRNWKDLHFSSFTIKLFGVLINVYGPTKSDEKKAI